MKTITDLKLPQPAEAVRPPVIRTVARIVSTLARALGAAALLAIASFCVFGFLAAVEPGNGWLWKVGYGAIGSGCLAGAVAMLRPSAFRIFVPMSLLTIAVFSVLGFMASRASSGLSGQIGFGLLAIGCLAVAVALPHPNGRSGHLTFWSVLLLFALFGAFSCKFAMGILIPLVSRLLY
ncbi:MAG: hypothetical protein ABSH48_19850 [Verrucomicrobiota bacterium]|jgi:hypothetical protein